MVRHVIVVPYDPAWPVLAAAEMVRLCSVFGAELVEMHHFGSTAVPGLSAKPIIDLLPEVVDIARVDALNPAMQALGYTPMGENGIPRRRYFWRGQDDEHTHHVHVFQQGDSEVTRHLAVRDYLRTHSDEAAAYGQLKEELARRFPTDVDGYIEGKDAFVKALEQRALEWYRNLDARLHL